MEGPSVNTLWNPVAPDPPPARTRQALVRLVCLCGLALFLLIAAGIGLIALLSVLNPQP